MKDELRSSALSLSSKTFAIAQSFQITPRIFSSFNNIHLSDNVFLSKII